MGREKFVKVVRKVKQTITIKGKDGQGVKAVVVGVFQGRGNGYMKLWQETGWESKLDGLQGRSVKVLLLLVMVARWGNGVSGPTEIARRTGMKQPHVSKAYGELVKADFLRKIDGYYILNPLFCWKGDDKQYEDMVALFSPENRLVNLPAMANRE